MLPMEPWLQAQLVNPDHATLSAGSNKRVPWRCPKDPRHVWEAAPNTRRRSPGCPVCLNKTVIAGVNDIATTHPELAAQLVDPQVATTIPAGSNTPQRWTCGQTGHEWTAKPVTRVRMGTGCPQCWGRVPVAGVNDLATTHPDLARQLVDPSIATTISAGSSTKPRWRCEKFPSHVWEAIVSNRTIHGSGCPYCAGLAVEPGFNDLATLAPKIAAQLDDPSLGTKLTLKSNRKVGWRCEHGHRWEATVASRSEGYGCPTCSGRIRDEGINDLATTYPEIAAQLVDKASAKTLAAGSHTRVEWECTKGHRWFVSPKVRTQSKTGCPQCAMTGTSEMEKDLIDVITTLLPDEQIVLNSRSHLPGRHELDIVIPDKHMAIEFNGLYWHSETAGKEQDYHKKKSNMASQIGLRLVHVWEDDWRTRRDVIARGLAHRLKVINRLDRVVDDIDPKVMTRAPARTLSPMIIDGARAAQFLQANHIQGKVIATHHLGLVDADGDLRALLSIRLPRSNARMKQAEGQWEIQRYATLGLVPGGFTRLLTFATRFLPEQGVVLTQWISLSADDTSDGGMYLAAGFEIDATLAPDYTYAGPFTQWVRTPKERFQKKRFEHDDALVYESGWTEHEAAAANRLHRVYDAGKTRWVKNIE